MEQCLWIWRRHPTPDSLHGCASKSGMQMFTTTVGQRQKWAYSTMVKYVKAPLQPAKVSTLALMHVTAPTQKPLRDSRIYSVIAAIGNMNDLCFTG
ncbi:hypothetical protein K7X08_019939 [Anisodus acutangulus]|uniref:Uncharacterized protein n=1 Tax=Anisodus acutangulus TaxID=402998 RepID=A0A9Q1MTB7_9SOLA|nr:hypothetical protein K7X08_019939 [Anisodus acutangulus]